MKLQQSLDLAYNLCRPHAQVLDLHRKGVQVRIITDNDQANTQVGA